MAEHDVSRFPAALRLHPARERLRDAAEAVGLGASGYAQRDQWLLTLRGGALGGDDEEPALARVFAPAHEPSERRAVERALGNQDRVGVGCEPAAERDPAR